MKNRLRICAAVIILIIAVSAVLFFAWYYSYSGDSAEIYLDHRLIRTVNLLEEQEFVVEIPGGGHNTVTVRDGKIAVTEADCPDKVCVGTGFQSGRIPVICLPHRLEIRVITSGLADIDGVSR
ncbi:lipoprotein [Clostridia bacterium]|nr:lipoprotein [Clostridia bacterium]